MPGDDSEALLLRPMIGAGLLGVFAGAAALAARVGEGIGLGPWQGAYLDPNFPYRIPLLSLWSNQLALAVSPADDAWTTTALALILCAASCGLLASLCALHLQGKVRPSAATLFGAMAGLLFACTPVVQFAVVDSSPAALSVLLMLGAALLLSISFRTGRLGWLFAGNLAAGLAAANEPSYAVLFVILVIASLGHARENSRATLILVTACAGFAVGASAPIFTAWRARESASTFLNHALATAYPTIGDAWPKFGFWWEIRGQFSWPVLAIACLSLVLFFAPRHRGPVVLWGLLFLAMGPFLPALTNQQTSAYVLRDASGPKAIAAAAICLVSTWFCAAVYHEWAERTRRRRAQLAIVGASVVAIAVSQWQPLPVRERGLAVRIASDLLDDCEQGAILVVGDERTHSLLRTLQVARGHRPDITIVDQRALEVDGMRARLAADSTASLRINPLFPPIDAAERWPAERPRESLVLMDRLRRGTARMPDMRDLLLWEFVRDNFRFRPIHFAGVTTPWLTARAQTHGVTLRYPRAAPTAARSFQALQSAQPDASRGPDAELSGLAVALLVPVAEAHRRQNDLDEAERVASLARQFGADRAPAWLVSARTAARRGQRDKALAFAERYLQVTTDRAGSEQLTALIQEDLRRNAVAAEFETIDIDFETGSAEFFRRKQLAAELWDLEELRVLLGGYARTMEGAPPRIEDLYESAAILVQLGEFERARERLREAIGIDVRAVWRRMQTDGRFALLRVDSSGLSPAVHG